MKNCLSICAAATIFVPIRLLAQEVSEDGQIVDLYQAPRVEVPAAPVYPIAAARTGKEGWVMLNFMVDPEGRAYEVRVIERAGDEAFIAAAQQALEKTEFEPAKVGEQAVNGSTTHMYRFVMERSGPPGARRAFASRYRRFMEALEEQSQAEAADRLMRLADGEIHNNYEYAYLSLARYSFALRYGSALEAMEHLHNALGESAARPELQAYLPEDVATSARRGLMRLRLQNGYFREAVDVWHLMETRGDEEGLALFREVYDQISAFGTNDESYAVPGQLDEHGSWYIGLFKDGFFLGELAGRVDELKLRCQRDYVFFSFDPETRYEIAENAGECSLEIIGDPGTTFTLIQQ